MPEHAPDHAAMTPLPYRVVEHQVEIADVATLTLEPVGDAIPTALPGQFTMLHVPGVGESAISYSRISKDRLVHTIRGVGAVSNALMKAMPGDLVGVRGPFGKPWPVALAEDGDLLIVAGGLGLAPLRPVIDYVVAHRSKFREVSLVAGARSPEAFVFLDDVKSLQDVDVQVTVDSADSSWKDDVGLVTRFLKRARAGSQGHAFVCGPELMMKFSAFELLKLGFEPDRIFLSMERKMFCGIGHCGHCQLGPYLICRDGPVMTFTELQPLLNVREL